MGAPLIGALRVSLSAETASFEAGMKRAQRTTATAATSMSRSLGLVKTGLSTLAAGLSIGLFARAISSSLEYAGSLAEVAQQVGVTAKDLQVLRFAGGQVGISTEEMDKALQKFTKSLGDARNGSAEATKTFKALGFSDKDIAKLDAHEALLKTADGLAKVTDRAVRASPEVRLLGRAGQQLDPLLSQGSKGILELTKAAEKLGIVLSYEQIKHADDAADRIHALATVLKVNFAATVADNAESILGLANSIGAVSIAITRFLGSNPTAAVALMGAMAGGFVGGLPGAALGGLAGSVAGSQIDTPFNPAANPNKKLLQHNLDLARQRGDKAAVARLETKLNGSPSLPTLPGLDLGKFLAGAGAKKAADHSAQDALRNAYQFDQELRRAQMDVLNATQDLSHDYVERTTIGIEILNAEKAAFDAEQQYQVALFKLTKGKEGLSAEQSAQLKAEFDKTDALKRQAILEEEQAQKREDIAMLVQTDFDTQKDKLQSELQLAETAQEQRDIQLKLLDLSYRQERARLEAVIADEKASDAAKEDARRRLLGLNATYGNDRQAVVNNTRGPIETFIALTDSANKVNEAMQALEVEGFNGLIDSVLALSDGMHSATESLLNTLKQFLLGLARLELQKMLGGALQSGGGGFGGILGSIAGSLFGGGSAAASGGGLGSFAPGAAGYPTLGFASGGSGIFKGIPGIDRNVVSINGMPQFRVSYGERWSIGNDNHSSSGSMGRGGNVYMTVNTPDADSFRRSQGQTTRSLKRRLA